MVILIVGIYGVGRMVMASDVPTLLVAMKMDKILSFQDSNLAAAQMYGKLWAEEYLV